MKYNKYLNILLYIFILCIIYNGVYAQENENENNDVANTENNDKQTTNDENNNVNNNDNSNNSNSNNNEEEEEEVNTNKSKEEEEMERECSANIGNILFQKPDSKSIVVPYSNFTIIWYYDSRGFDVIYPYTNITFLLFKAEDANYNDYLNAWKNPIFTKTVQMNEIQPGPERTDGKPVYQWDWDTNFYANEGYTQYPSLNAQYKLRIVGDGKDITTNKENFECYMDGDLTPGSTSSFYIVKNNALGTFKPLVIENGGSSVFKSTKLITTIIISVAISFLLIF